MSFLIATPGFVLADEADPSQARFDFNKQGMNRALKTIREELTKASDGKAPSEKLKQAVADLESHIWVLRANSDQHNVDPPKRSQLDGPCKSYFSQYRKDFDLFMQDAKELKKIIQARDSAIRVRDWVADRQHNERIAAIAQLFVAGLTPLSPLSIKGTAVVGVMGVVNLFVEKLREQAPEGPGGPAGIFLRDHKSAIANSVHQWCTGNNLDCSAENLKKDSTLMDAYNKRISEEIRLLADQEANRYHAVGLTFKKTFDPRLDQMQKRNRHKPEFKKLCDRITSLKLWHKGQPQLADNQGPQLWITSHKDGDRVGESGIILKGIATDSDRGDNGIDSVLVDKMAIVGREGFRKERAGGDTASGGDNAKWIAPVRLSKGENEITVEAYDNNSNRTAIRIRVFYELGSGKREKKIEAFWVDCDPETIFEDQATICKAKVRYKDGSVKHVNQRVTWSPADVIPSTGHVRGQGVKEKSKSLPVEVEVTAHYHARPGEAGVDKPAKGRFTVKPRPAVPKATAATTKKKCVEVPYVIFKTKDAALQSLEGVGLGSKIRTDHSYNHSASEVMDQQPYVGDCVPPGTVVHLVVSLGSPQMQELIVEPATVAMEVGETVEFSARMEYSDGSHNYLTYGATWTPGPTYKFTATKPGTYTIMARWEKLSGSATVTVGKRDFPTAPPLPPPGTPLPSAGPEEYTWYAFCKKRTGEIVYGKDYDATRFHIMGGPFPGPRNSVAWIDENCPNWRCTAAGQCATVPATTPPGVEGWHVLCEWRKGSVTLGKHPNPTRHKVMAGPFLGEPDARSWTDTNCPNWRCSSAGQCPTAPAAAPPGADGWNVLCERRTGAVTLGKKPNPTRHSVMAGPFLGEPDARSWTDTNCPNWRCTDRGGCAAGATAGTAGSSATASAPGGSAATGKWHVLCSRNRSVVLSKNPSPAGVMAGPFSNEPGARAWANSNCPSWLCDGIGRCVAGPTPVGVYDPTVDPGMGGGTPLTEEAIEEAGKAVAGIPQVGGAQGAADEGLGGAVGPQGEDYVRPSDAGPAGSTSTESTSVPPVEGGQADLGDDRDQPTSWTKLVPKVMPKPKARSRQPVMPTPHPSTPVTPTTPKGTSTKPEPPKANWVAYYNVDQYTCCKGDGSLRDRYPNVKKDETPHPLHIGRDDQLDKKRARTLKGGFTSHGEAKRWVCGHKIRQTYNWISNIARISGVLVSNTPCKANLK